jgi:hypothetical protein
LEEKPSCYRFLKKLLDTDAAVRRSLIRRFKFESTQEDPLDAIRALIRITVSAEMVDECCRYAVGRAKDEVEALIRAGQPPLVKAGTFQLAFRAFVHKHDLSGLLTSIEPAPPASVIAKTLAGSPVFVRQLEIIDLPQELRLRAVSDFLQASACKTRWAEKGQVVFESLAEFDENLIRRHGFVKMEIDETHTNVGPMAQGRTLYARCAITNITLEGREVPGHFVPGCFNELANRFLVGWHPNYKAILDPEKG